MSVATSAGKGIKEAAQKVMGHWAFWVVVAILLLILLWSIKGAIQKWWDNFNRSNHADTSGQGMNEQDIARIKALAMALRTAINSWTSEAREDLLNQAVALNATELLALAEEYAIINDGGSLLEDLNSEWTLPDVGERLIARLNEVGAPKARDLEPVEQVTIQPLT